MAGITQYKEEYIQKVEDYLLTCGDEFDEFHKTRSDSSNSYERIVNVNLPMIEGFAEYIDVHKDTLYKWEKENPDFSDALDKIRKVQHNMLVKGGVSNRYNPAITKLMLMNNHGYKEKSDVTTDGKAININFDNSFSE